MDIITIGNWQFPNCRTKDLQVKCDKSVTKPNALSKSMWQSDCTAQPNIELNEIFRTTKTHMHSASSNANPQLNTIWNDCPDTWAINNTALNWTQQLKCPIFSSAVMLCLSPTFFALVRSINKTRIPFFICIHILIMCTDAYYSVQPKLTSRNVKWITYA